MIKRRRCRFPESRQHSLAFNPDHLMQRVVILGRGGAGKSTFARKLGEATGLPVIELDKYFWQPGLVPTPRERWAEILRELASGDRWILDGDLGRYDDLHARLQRADTVVILDFSVWLCVKRAVRRSRETFEFWWWLLSWRRRDLPKIQRAIAAQAAHADIRIFSRPEELERFCLCKRATQSWLFRARRVGQG